MRLRNVKVSNGDGFLLHPSLIAAHLKFAFNITGNAKIDKIFISILL